MEAIHTARFVGLGNQQTLSTCPCRGRRRLPFSLEKETKYLRFCHRQPRDLQLRFGLFCKSVPDGRDRLLCLGSLERDEVIEEGGK